MTNARLILLAIACGIVLISHARRQRQLQGLTVAPTQDLDATTLYSDRYRLSGRPDRIVREGTTLIPEEWKSARRVYDSHRVQLSVYLLLIEENYRVTPPYGWIVLADGGRTRVMNTPQLRQRVLAIADAIRQARRQIHAEIAVNPWPTQCRSCGQRRNCRQSKA